MFAVDPVSRRFDEQIQLKIQSKVQNKGALGQLESIATQIARVQLTKNSRIKKLSVRSPGLLVFTADHGIAKFGVSANSGNTSDYVMEHFSDGRAAIQLFSRQMGLHLEVINAGLAQPCHLPDLTQHSLGRGTAAFHLAPAMSLEQVRQGFEAAVEIVERHELSGCNFLAIGELGAGNSTAASAVMAALLDIEVHKCVSRSCGISESAYNRKKALINEALYLHRGKLISPVHILAHVGGFELVQMTGAILAAAERKIIVLIDGFCASVAALVALKLHPAVKDYLVFAQQSDDLAEQMLISHLIATPLLKLNLRLGKGTGAALAMPLIQAAVNFYNEMVSTVPVPLSDLSCSVME